MIKEKDLPQHIQEALENYKEKGETSDVAPYKFNVNNKNYYFFGFPPSFEKLLIREDGVVPALEDVKKVGLVAYAYNTSVGSLNEAQEWTNGSRMKIYETTYEQLLKLRKWVQYEAQASVNKDIEDLLDVLKSLIREQKKVIESIESAIQLYDNTLQKEITSEDDQKTMRQYVQEMVRADFSQNEIQISSEKPRNRMIEYLSSNKWSGLKKRFTIHKLKKNLEGMLSKDKMDSGEREERIKLKNELESKIPIETDPKGLELLNEFRNP